MKKYDHKKIEPKWQKEWEKSGIYKSVEDSQKPKAYILDMFPYPSGEGLHVGHPKGYIATDVYARHKRMSGHSVLHPMGWDAFGLPAENYALKNKEHPKTSTDANVARYKKQLEIIGLDYDWSREVNTTDPSYYKWTQWIFTKLFEKGLAFESHEPINWCPSCQTGLANEDLEDGKCERCGSEVEKKPMRQWVLKIREYADRLLGDLEELPRWPEYIKEMQRNWIGRSEGAEIEFKLTANSLKLPAIKVFTTRPDTLFGATYMVLAPENALVQQLKPQIENWGDVELYIAQAGKKSEIDRTAEGREKSGVELKGVSAINPATKEEIPVYIADYVLASYGTGAIMAVPAHDERDFAFAQQFDLPIRYVVDALDKAGTSAYTGEGILTNSDQFDALNSEEAKQKITEHVGGTMTTTYRLQDWVFSRQRYWGEPIPIIHCKECGPVAVPEKDLPVKLPDVQNYEPTGTGESPLANIPGWVNTTCPKCNGAGKRETNTMPQWAGSSWYYLRYMDPNNDEALVDPAKEKYWAPVDVYVGGAEHATRHLIYARFWHKFLYDVGVVSTVEPFMELHSVGLIQAEDGRKMSKRWGNVVNPDDTVEQVGADSLRVYEMFMGPFENAIAWSTDGLVGARRFLERVWRLQEKLQSEDVHAVESELHKTIKKVSEDIPAFKFNTAIAQMMTFINLAEKEGVGKEQYKTFLKLLAPFAPHMTEELWSELDKSDVSIHVQSWPEYDERKLMSDTVTIAVQVNGKTRGTVEVPAGSSEEGVRPEAEKAAEKWLADAEVAKVIFVPDRLINFVLQ